MRLYLSLTIINVIKIYFFLCLFHDNNSIHQKTFIVNNNISIVKVIDCLDLRINFQGWKKYSFDSIFEVKRSKFYLQFEYVIFMCLWTHSCLNSPVKMRCFRKHDRLYIFEMTHEMRTTFFYSLIEFWYDAEIPN